MTAIPLLIISAVVLVRLAQKRNAWGWIVAYWAVLVVRNLVDTITG